MPDEIEISAPVNSHPAIVELEAFQTLQGSTETEIILNVGLRFGVPLKNVNGITLESGILAARLHLECENCSISGNYTNVPSWSNVEVEATRNQSTEQKRTQAKGASLSLAKLGVDGKQTDSEGQNTNSAEKFKTRVVIVEAQSGNVWNIENTLNDFLSGLILGGESSLCIANIAESSFQVTAKLFAYPGELRVRRRDGLEIPEERRKLMELIEAKNLGKDDTSGAILLCSAYLRGGIDE